MRKIVASMVATLVLFGAFLAFSGVATADHSSLLFMEDFGSRINLLNECFFGDLMITYPADTLFWVSHGWFFGGWSELSPEDRRAINHPSTTFVLLIDGEVQKSAQHTRHFPDFDSILKLFTSEYHKGLPAGVYTFTDNHYLDGSLVGGDFRDPVLQLDCDVEVTFT